VISTNQKSKIEFITIKQIHWRKY